MRWRLVLETTGLDTCPLDSLDDGREGRQRGEDDDGLHSHSLAVVELWLGCPREERDDLHVCIFLVCGGKGNRGRSAGSGDEAL